MSLILQDSLSKALSCYFPFAGKLTDKDSIECNNEGFLFLEVQLNTRMNNIVDYPDAEDLVSPQGLPWGKSSKGHLAVLQLSYFK